MYTYTHTHTHTPDDDRSEKDHEDLPISITYQRPPHPQRHLSIGNFQRRTVVAIAILCLRVRRTREAAAAAMAEGIWGDMGGEPHPLPHLAEEGHDLKFLNKLVFE